MGYKRFLLVETIDKLVNIDRFNMIQCERYFQAKIGLSTNDHIGGWNHNRGKACEREYCLFWHHCIVNQCKYAPWEPTCGVFMRRRRVDMRRRRVIKTRV